MTKTHQPSLKGSRPMTAAPKPKRTGSKGHMFDDPDALTALAQQSFHKATREAIDENDRRGVPSYGGKDGKIVVRQPRQAKTSTGPT